MALFGGLGLGLLGAGSSILGGFLGGDDEQSQLSTFSNNQQSSTSLGDLPPELQELLSNALSQSGALSDQLGRELLNSPDGLSLDALSQNPVGNLQSMLNESGLTDGVQQAFDEATQGSFDLARQNLERDLGFLSDEAQAQRDRSVQQIDSTLASRGIRGGSTIGAGAIAREFNDIDRRMNQAIQQGQAQLGQLGVANMQNRAQGLLQAQGLSQQAALGFGNLQLGARGQSIGLRNQADANRALLLSNPLTQQLFQRQLATSTTRSSSSGTNTGTASGGSGGLASAFGAIGGNLIQGALGGFGEG